MGNACGGTNSSIVMRPSRITPFQINENQEKILIQNYDLMSIDSLQSRVSIKKKQNIGYFFVEDTQMLEGEKKFIHLQWKQALSQYQKEREVDIRQEKIFSKKTDNMLLSFKSNKFSNFQALIEQGIPLNLRWNVWKVSLFNKSIYNDSLYQNLLEDPTSSQFEYDILKDIHRTYPTHPYFQNQISKRGGEILIEEFNIGQKKLFSILRALAINFPDMGYTQGMNFILAFLLMMSSEKDNEAFWVFLFLAKDPNFLLMGFFEQDFPMMKILLYIFDEKFKSTMPQLFNNFQAMGFDSFIWAWKWFMTLFLYSFPTEVVVKLWDYVIIHGSLSLISLALGIVKYFEKKLLNLDLDQLQSLFQNFKETKILVDLNSEYFLDFKKLLKLAQKFQINFNSAGQCVRKMTEEKKMENKYTKFFTLREKNQKEAEDWIQSQLLGREVPSDEEEQKHDENPQEDSLQRKEEVAGRYEGDFTKKTL